MKSIYIVTGACGHLGGVIVDMLAKQGKTVRALKMSHEVAPHKANTTYYNGDITDISTLEPLFASDNARLYVIHTAGIIDIGSHVSPHLYDVNVGGTKNIIQLCNQYSVARLVHVSSVHAIPELDSGTICEVDSFDATSVVGAYAKTKAEATQAVIDATYSGLNAVVVHPSGILGPYGNDDNHLVQLVTKYLDGTLPACVKGGYDFVDVRDVATACISATTHGNSGDSYILSNQYYTIKQLLDAVALQQPCKKLCELPLWLAKLALPMMWLIAKITKQRPLFTRYSLHTISTNGNFCHSKATKCLGYKPRSITATIADTISWHKHHTTHCPA